MKRGTHKAMMMVPADAVGRKLLLVHDMSSQTDCTDYIADERLVTRVTRMNRFAHDPGLM